MKYIEQYIFLYFMIVSFIIIISYVIKKNCSFIDAEDTVPKTKSSKLSLFFFIKFSNQTLAKR